MNACNCPLAGWCDRHGVDKSPHWHKLCQTRKDYRQAWDKGKGPGQLQKPLTNQQKLRQARIVERVKRQHRLIGWLVALRHPGEVGVGDTAARIRAKSRKKKPAVHSAVKQLMTQCSCRESDSIARLNADHPYAK